jgi:hypothetical protein
VRIVSTVVLPVSLPFFEEEDRVAASNQAFEAVANDPEPYNYESDWGRTAAFVISGFENATEFDAFAAAWPSYTDAFDYRFLRLDASVEADLEEYSITLHSRYPDTRFNAAQIEHFACGITAAELSRQAGLYVVAANIAFPGAINVGERYQISADRFIESNSALGSRIWEAKKEAVRIGWPQLPNINVREVWRWMSGVPGILEGHGRGPAGRGVAALSFLFSDVNKPALELVWALVGLEALYGHGNSGVKSQLLEKSEVLLGPRLAHKRRFGRMYDYRSRFVHGDIDLPLAFCEDSSSHQDAFESESDESMFLAVAMLVATLQKLVSLERYALDFDYTLRS